MGAIWNLKKLKTATLIRADLTENATGQIVSKAKSLLAKEYYSKNGFVSWITSLRQARDEMGLTGMVCPSADGTAVQKKLLKRARELNEAAKVAKAVDTLQSDQGQRR